MQGRNKTMRNLCTTVPHFLSREKKRREQWRTSTQLKYNQNENFEKEHQERKIV
jgi:hypothetical protein